MWSLFIVILPVYLGEAALEDDVHAQDFSSSSGIPEHSVSGVSSGGDMAVNHLVAFSRKTTGAGIVAGAPYGCNRVEGGNRDVCGMGLPRVPWKILLRRLDKYMHRRAAAGLIDPVESLRGRQLYLFSGVADWVVNRKVMVSVQDQLATYTGQDTIKLDFNVNATHGWVVDGSQCGPGKPGSEKSWCGQCCCTPSPLLSCGGHDLAGRLLQHLGVDLPLSRKTYQHENLLLVPQHRYVPAGYDLNVTGMWHTAYVYAPTRCRGKSWSGCKVHVHYHGCAWGAQFYGGPSLLKRLGFLEWAEASDLVVVFPQASASLDGIGCWDWTGVTNHDFDTNQGVQLRTVTALLADLPRILSQTTNTNVIDVNLSDGIDSTSILVSSL
eukprot:gnl/MRDRNA2_/MRDRNA2_138805_c0_seq1.p1 gnl/MRDRNA2_/MRDRNA2_138805_c0~~gnl/MRDRNA2_/MRDRNA2_138805_c0_seq1.p1  ORF type:complete len:381 (-),score=41.34 gnl/MRDRNA2_/MRDRNA2_138805_c0_seq1:111-1253(-)